jgi:hypothetical protein
MWHWFNSFSQSPAQTLGKGINILLINIAVLAALLGVSEMALSLDLVVHSCVLGACDFTKLWDVQRKAMRFDKELGYVPTENFNSILTPSQEAPYHVTITKDGFRKIPGPPKTGPRILALGASYTFGSQASDEETWTACLENNLDAPVDNAGVTGYGAAQSLKRGEVVLAKSNAYDTVILAVMVDRNLSTFSVEKYSYWHGSSRPAVISVNGHLQYADVPDKEQMEALLDDGHEGRKFLGILYRNSLLASKFMDLLENKENPGDLHSDLEIRHPKAATDEEIMPWVLERFSKLNVKRRVLLLQYQPTSYTSLSETMAERKRLLKAARKYGVYTIDTFDLFRKESPSIFLEYHLSPFGNKAVCNAVTEGLAHYTVK